MKKAMQAVDVAYMIGTGEIDAQAMLMEMLRQMPGTVVQIYEAMRLAVSPDFRDRVIATYDKGNGYIEAIKMYRNETGVGLKEAKDAVDQLVGKA